MRKFVELAWDFFLSFSIRAFCTIALFAGVNVLIAMYYIWHCGLSDGEGQAGYLLAGLLTLGGLVGTFRRGKAEARFSMASLGTYVLSAAGSMAPIPLPKPINGHLHVHLDPGRIGERPLRRFPSTESFLLGMTLIALWIVQPFWRENVWVLRIGAIIGATQIVWGMMLELFGTTAKFSTTARDATIQDTHENTNDSM